MKRLAWITDIHLNFVTASGFDTFCRAIVDARVDSVLLGGDISEAPDVVERLEALAARLGLPIHFVLGNHDFYRGGIARVRKAVRALCTRSPGLCWLTEAGAVALTPQTGLVGHDGWSDGRLGDYARSPVLLNDYRYIEELTGLDAAARLRQLNALGDEAAAHLRRVLPAAMAEFSRLILLTHVPPFREACWHQGRIADDDWLPHFSCRAMGEVLLEAMAAHPDRDLTVLCGHCHGAGEAQILPNLRVRTGGAEYGHPELQRVLLAD